MSTMSLDPELLRSLMKLHLPEPNLARAGWKLDRTAITEALDSLQITLPVVVRFRKYRERQDGSYTYGMHYGRRKGIHEVKLNDMVSANSANHTLWHELAHAMQEERWSRETGRPAHEFHNAEYASPQAKGPHGASYRLNKYEVEAEKVAEANKHKLLILTIGG